MVKKMKRKNQKEETCFGLFHGMELVGFGCGGSYGVINVDDPRVADYTPVAGTGMYRVYFKS